MEAKGKCPAKRTPQTGFPSLFQGPLGAGSSGTAAISSATALAGTSALPSSCLPRAGSALPITSHCSQGRGSQSRFQAAFRSCHLLLCRDTGCGHTDTRTHSTPRAAAGSAPGAHSVHFPWNLVGRIQSVQWDSIWEKHFGTQLPVTVNPAQGLPS